MHAIVQNAPPQVVDPLIWLVSLYFTVFPSRAAAAGSKMYLAAALGRRPSFSDRHRQVRNFAHVVVDRVGLLSDGAAAFDLRSRNESLVASLHAQRRGAVLLGAHFGSFEAMRAFDRTLPGLSIRYLMFEDNAEMTSRMLQRINPALSRQVIPLRDGIDAMLTVCDALEEGNFVAYLGDRAHRRNMRAEVEVDFLGHRARFPRAPYMSAMLAKVPIILCFAPRVGRRAYEIEFMELHDGSPVPRRERDEKCRELAQRYADALGDMCRRHPYNWFNFFDIWR
ncbi:hypothetical protein H0I76_16855 [Limibaculum sp. M0105]|uniref:Lipid A biosynthesis acyltransferase n=1 Tax=Thermohalobaculum xanthum TaxID=2753746 RepID=A0A8J7SHN7_9RHOB|nr:hypothetical protein [Thermohalobaculum xanthum]MBK0400872.1 hypothetical protein [Thermohalobaculum xanthum]